MSYWEHGAQLRRSSTMRACFIMMKGNQNLGVERGRTIPPGKTVCLYYCYEVENTGKTFQGIMEPTAAAKYGIKYARSSQNPYLLVSHKTRDLATAVKI
jgi:hypothetical protein